MKGTIGFTDIRIEKPTVTRGWILILWSEIFDILQNATLEEDEDAKILSHIESKLKELGVEVSNE